MAKLEIVPKNLVPSSGVTLISGVFNEAFENNMAYLKGLSQDSILYWFRKKAGKATPGEPYRGHFEDNIKGQTAGLFLMGAANTLRWEEDSQLRQRVNDIVDEIAEATEKDGFNQPIPKSEFGTIEYPNYVRVWMNYGLIAAANVGNEKALPLVRGMQTWFNHCDEKKIAKDLDLGYQGVIANTSVYLSEVGEQEDVAVTVQYYQEDWWLAQLISLNPGAIHKHHRPHGTELEAITAYMDLYMITAKPLYLNAVNGAYRLFKEQWQHVGGGIVAIEHTDMEPGCQWVDPIHKYNELCCSAHWIYLNQRYHQLYPDQEEYVSEIEKSLYNIAIANQSGSEHIRYHAYLDTQKDENRETPVSCCAGLGTRLFGSLPEFLYTMSEDGVYVDIYASSEIRFRQAGNQIRLTTMTDLPVSGEVRIRLEMESPQTFTIHLRMPSWNTESVSILVNGKFVTAGEAGSYVKLSREWAHGDTIEFVLPLEIVARLYEGKDQVKDLGRYAMKRYSFEFGALLLAVVGPLNFGGRFIRINHDPNNPKEWMIPDPKAPGHYSILGMPNHHVVPYHEIEQEVFTCFPVF